MPLSGPDWVAKFPTSKSAEDLQSPFRENVKRFLAALGNAHAVVSISATLRPSERAYLMHYAYVIAIDNVDPASVEARNGVDIQWVHPTLQASKAAAKAMVDAYGIVHKPSLNTNHGDGNAIDMTISWNGNLTILKGDGTLATISTVPRSGENTSLHSVGATYGVIKLATDPPHWSATGH